MKFDNLQVTFRYITPGLYLIAMLILLSGGMAPNSYLKPLAVVPDGVLVVLVPFVGFVVGYILEGLMVFVERIAYKVGIKSPEQKILHGTSLYYHLDDTLRKRVIRDLRKRLKDRVKGIEEKAAEIAKRAEAIENGTNKHDLFKVVFDDWNCIHNNSTGKLCLQVAQEMMGENAELSRHLDRALMARNLLCAQIFVSIYFLARQWGPDFISFVPNGVINCIISWLLALSAIGLLGIAWYHLACVYNDHLFAEYGKMLLEGDKKS